MARMLSPLVSTCTLTLLLFGAGFVAGSRDGLVTV
jgi:hypothetical protein